jgi:hypothetical protein
MKLSDAIDKGIECVPGKSSQALASHLGLLPPALSAAKSGRRGLEEKACVKLALLINADPLELIAASRVITAKDYETKQFWQQFAKAAAIGPLAAMSIALVTMIVTPSEAEAAPLHQQESSSIHIMLNRLFTILKSKIKLA